MFQGQRNILNQITKHLLLWALLASTLLSGCSLTPPAELQPVDVSHPSQALAWELKGKLSVKTPDDKLSANLYWLHTQQEDKLVLTSMLGTSLLTLTSNPNGALLEVGSDSYQDTNAQRLLTRVTGWSLPLHKLPLWITGQPQGNDLILQTDKANRPKQIQSQGQPAWNVYYTRWQEQSGAQIPRLLSVKREGIRLKIQTNQWQALDNQAVIVK